jgi:NAD-dependent dihydropyrimidine dehydrogenase PreA subunit
MHIIRIDMDKCTGCTMCYKACFVDVIRWDLGKKRPIVKYPEECATCNWCELSCPVNAIQVIPNNPVPIPEPYPKSVYPGTYSKS